MIKANRKLLVVLILLALALPVHGMVAEEPAVTGQGSATEASADGFFISSLELTFQVRTYTMLAGSSTSLREVLSAVGLSGDPVEASITGSGNNFALKGSNLETWRLQAAAVPDEGEQSLLVKLNGIAYQIPLRISGETLKNTGIKYRDEMGLIQSLDEGYATANTGIWQSSGGFTGWWVVEKDTTINQRVMVAGDVRLILTDGVTLTVNGGVQVAEGNRLTIYGQQLGSGALKTISPETTEDNPAETGAGIGGAYVENGRGNAGEIIIRGGHVTAVAGMAGCAGIGGGTEGSAVVTITGGTVTGTGCWNGPGIGGLGANTNVVITAGNVTGIGGSEGGEAITGHSETGENSPYWKTDIDIIVVSGEAPEMKVMQLPSGLTAIGANAFSGNTASVVLVPKDVASVGDRAFAGSGTLRILFYGENTEFVGTPFEDRNAVIAFAPKGSTTLNRLSGMESEGVAAFPLE